MFLATATFTSVTDGVAAVAACERGAADRSNFIETMNASFRDGPWHRPLNQCHANMGL